VDGKHNVRNIDQEKARCTFPHVIKQQRIEEGQVAIFQAIEVDVLFKIVML